MNAILGWLSMLAKGDAVRNPGQAMAVIQRNAHVQEKLIEHLLEMNELVSGTVRLDRETIDLRNTLDASMQALQRTAEAKSILVVSTVDPSVPLILADGRRVQQVLWNVLHNAVKFTPPGGRIDILVTRVDSAVRVVVKDTGQGIAADFLPFVFDRFRQADSSTTRGAWGLGLGLSIAKYLVELHGGSIEASSEGLGRGATFLVQLPVSIESSRTRLPDADAEARERGSARAGRSVSENMSGMRSLRNLSEK